MSEELVLKGVYRGRVKCTYGIVNDEQGQPIFTFSTRGTGLNGADILIAKDIRMIKQIPALLTPEARQWFLGMCEDYGWYLSADGTLQEVPNYLDQKVEERGTTQTIERLYIDKQGNLQKEVIQPDLSEMTQRNLKQWYGERHQKFYPKAVQLLPYISGEKNVYVRPQNFRWKEEKDLEQRVENNTEEVLHTGGGHLTARSWGLIIGAITLLTSK